MAAKVRTQEELTLSKYNYFIVLNLGVSEKNPNNIQQAIKKKFPQNQGISKDPYLSRLMELKPDIEQVLLNDAVYNAATDSYVPKSGARKEEADRAKTFKLNEAMQIVRMKCQANGILNKSELRKICSDANTKGVIFFEFAELEKAFFAEKLDKLISYVDNETNTINFTSFDDISDLLIVEGKSDLYDYLGVSPTASSKTILAEETRVTNEKLNSTGDKEKKNKYNAFSGNIQTIFKSDEMRKQYDYYLKARESVWSQFKLRKSYSREISLNEYIDFVGRLVKVLGVSTNEAKNMIGSGLKNYGLVVAAGDGTADKSKLGIPDLASCRFCGSLYVKGAKSCPSCGKLLISACWNCSTPIDLTQTSSCRKCGATEALQKTFNAEVVELNKLFSTGAYKEYALKSEAFKRTYSGLNQPNSLVEKEITAINSTANAIITKQRERETTTKKYLLEINSAIASRQYFKAQSILRELKAVIPDANVSHEETQINSVISEVQSIYRRICMLGNDEVRIVLEYMKLYEKCVDYSEAQSVIKKFPPQPPQEVTATPESKGNSIKWSVRPDDTITYTVLRKIGAPPRSVDDGEKIADGIKAFTYLDEKAENVVPYFYGVYATRLGSSSAPTCTLSAVQRLENVTIKGVKVLDNGLKVEFERIKGAKQIIVVRSNDATPPRSISSGTKIPVDESGFTDTTLPSSGLYGYYIVCEYEINGKTVYSSGVKQTYEYYERPSFVDNVRFKKEEGNTFSVVFDELAVGRFDIFASRTAQVCFKQGEYYDISKLDGLVDIDCKNVKPTSVNFDLPAKGDWFFYPVCIEKGEFTVGSEYVYRDTSPKSASVIYEVIVNKNATITINFSCDHLVELDEVRVVGTSGRRPRNVNDGESAGVIEKITFKKPLFSKEYKASVKLSVAGLNRGNVYAVFAENDSGIIFKRKG